MPKQRSSRDSRGARPTAGDDPTPITFLVPGLADGDPHPPERGSLRGAVRVGTTRDAGAGQGLVRLEARPGLDVVELVIANGPTLVLHPASARDLLRAQQPGTATRGGTPAADAGGKAGRDLDAHAPVTVPVELAWPGLADVATRAATRGFLGRALLAGLRVVTGVSVESAGRFAASAVVRQVDGQVDPGVYPLVADALTPLKGSGGALARLPAAADGGPLLVLIHGTFSNTAGTFGPLWALHGALVRDLFAEHGGRVYGFDHATLGASPIDNALMLARALPAGARVRLLTHSRGGLVGELLALACEPGALDGAAARALFEGAGYASHRRALQALADEAKRKRVVVERMVRVACPSRGTLLASKRLDAYLSAIRWSLQLAQVPVAPELVALLHAVAKRRADPAELPGLEAMMPASPLVRLLNGLDAAGTRAPIASELVVVAGDLQGDSVLSWMKTLLADAFYWTDNDLVVQTRSMYGGAPRRAAGAGTAEAKAGARFLLDRGGSVSHFAYFANERTARAVVGALTGRDESGLAPIGPLSWSGESSEGLRAARRGARGAARAAGRGAVRGADAARPSAIVIPGILGSNLALDGQRIWLGYRFVDALQQLAWNPQTATRVQADGAVGGVYDALVAHLAQTHETTVFAFDWRRPIEGEARRLADVVDAALAARATSGQPVRIVAHSMGGLVARTLAIERPATWQRFAARGGARLLMLGTPNAGSWSPMQTLSGDDTIGNTLAAVGSLFDNRGARDTMAGMPGFLQLQAGLVEASLRLDRAATWQHLADEDLRLLRERAVWHTPDVQQAIYAWGAPPQVVLDAAVALRRRLDAQAAAMGSGAADDLAPITRLVVGDAPFTPAGWAMTESGLEYVAAPGGGDGRVAHASAQLPGVPMWRLPVAHGDLPSVPAAFAAFVELLERGSTGLLESFALVTRAVGAEAAAATAPSTEPAGSGSAPLARSRPSRGLMLSAPPADAAEALRGSAVGKAAFTLDRQVVPALHVTVLNSDLRFVHEPLLVGHYQAMTLTGSEGVVDRLVGGAMNRSLAAGLYPGPVGTHQIFGNVRPDPENVLAMARPVAVIVAGMGEEGKLRPASLAQTVRQAVIAYAQRLADQAEVPTGFELASTPLGSGGAGISAGSAAQAIATGVQDANERLAEGGWPRVTRLVLVELYLDRASEAWRALQVAEAAAPQRLQLDGPVLSGAGALRRSLDSNYRGAAYDFISVATGIEPDGGRSIVYNLDTRRARTEVRAQRTQVGLVAELVGRASNDANRDAQIGRTLFDLLVPVEMEPFLGGTTEMVLEVDAGTAAIPWELLDTRGDAGSDVRPWAVRCKLLRKLRTAEFRAQPLDANAEAGVLVIGEPLVDDANYPPLPGARAEGEAVATHLLSPRSGLDATRVRALVDGRADARDVVNALFERPYRIVHVAGHGEPGGAAGSGAVGGVVLSGGHRLGPAEVRAMRVVPELVFLNCCHLAGHEARQTLSGALTYDRAAFAANIADALIEIGVRCVVAAGWAVEDGPAEVFATRFYDVLLDGGRFIEAVAAAREAAWQANPAGNTWAAYQCYGDPAWTWRRGRPAVAQRASSASLADEFAGVSSPPALTLALETIATGLRFGGDARRRMGGLVRQRDRIQWLESRYAPLWGAMGAVAEAFGLAWSGVREADQAIAWYRRALAAEDGSASFRAGEQLGNELARRGEQQPEAAAARRDIDEAIAILSRLVELHPTAEREALLGSAYKRQAMVEGRRGGTVRRETLARMARHYGEAERLARVAAKRGDGPDNLHYAGKNGLSAELRLAFLEQRQAEFAVERLQAVRESLERASRRRPDFWSVVGDIELAVLQAMVEGRLAHGERELTAAFAGLKARIPALDMWASVHDEARFTLEPYAAVASPAERRAAEALLEALAVMARGDG